MSQFLTDTNQKGKNEMWVTMQIAGEIVHGEIIRQPEEYRGPVRMRMVWGGREEVVEMSNEDIKRKGMDSIKKVDSNETVGWRSKQVASRVS